MLIWYYYFINFAVAVSKWSDSCRSVMSFGRQYRFAEAVRSLPKDLYLTIEAAVSQWQGRNGDKRLLVNVRSALLARW